MFAPHRSLLALAIVAGLTGCRASSDVTAAPSAVARSASLGFDDLTPGAGLERWRAESTNPHGPPAVWSVISDPTAPSAANAVALIDARGGEGDTYNLLWTDRVQWQDGFVRAFVKANEGEEDRGGGVCWRVQDAQNYYIARWNPLEDNFRVYCVLDGRRFQLESFQTRGNPDSWHEVRVEMSGERIACSLDGELLLEVRDARIPGAGGVGLWTKADAESAFDDFATGPLE